MLTSLRTASTAGVLNNMQLLLCIKSKHTPIGFLNVEAGTTYTLREAFSCVCRPGKADTFTLEEKPLPFKTYLRCRHCGVSLMFTHAPFDAERFVPLNDPDAKLDDTNVDNPVETVT